MVSRDSEFDQRMRERARREDCPVPADFEKEIASRLEALPPQKGGRRPGRRTAVILAAAVLLTACTAAAAVTRNGGRILFYRDEEELIRAAADAARSEGSGTAGYSVYEGADYNTEDMLRRANDLLKGEGAAVLEQAQGAPEDGWTRMRVVRWEDETDRRVSYYQGDSLSALAGVWEIPWDLTWLEAHYQARPGTHLGTVEVLERTGAIGHVSVVGEYQGQEGQVFNLQYWCFPGAPVGDAFLLTDGFEAAEYYQTADGAVAAVSMARSETGKNVFWVKYNAGEISFSMGGTQMALEEIHTVLDNLNLSALGQGTLGS